jgi:predicted N-formylglutamate amidohydrolase
MQVFEGYLNGRRLYVMFLKRKNNMMRKVVLPVGRHRQNWTNRFIDTLIEGNTPMIVTCEHGGDVDVGDPLIFTGAAAQLKGTHWAYDPGAADFARDLIKETKSCGIICNATRLYCDVNRPVGAETFARARCENTEIAANLSLSLEEREQRAREIWLPYHLMASTLARQNNINTVSYRVCRT